jgi:integrase
MRGHIRRRGNSSWELKLDLGRGPDGKRRTVYKTVRGSKRDAQAEIARLLAAQASGVPVEPNKLSVGAYLQERLTHWRAIDAVSPKTAQGYQQLIDQHIVPHLGDRLLQQLTPRDVESWHATLLTTGRRGRHGRPGGLSGVSARTVGHAHRVLSKALAEAAKHEIVARNVCSLQAPPRVNAVERPILNEQQVAEFETRLRGHAMEAITLVGLYTGIRRGEICGLRWRNVDFENEVVRIRESLEQTKAGLRFKLPKSRAGVRDIKLPAIVVDTLHAHRKRLLEQRLQLGQGKLSGDDFVFPALDGGPQAPETFGSRWGKLARSLGFKISFHILRHTHASMLISHGIDVVTISKRLGHVSPSITLNVYAHLFSKDDSKAAAVIDAALGRRKQ